MPEKLEFNWKRAFANKDVNEMIKSFNQTVSVLSNNRHCQRTILQIIIKETS